MYNAIKNKLPTQRKIKSLFLYSDGVLISKKTGHVVGTPNTKGYIQIYINGKKYLAHRLVYKLFHNIDPNLINHKNFNVCDNRIENLENVNNSENCFHRQGPNKNNKIGIRNIFFATRRKRYVVVIRGIFYGEYKNIFDAIRRVQEIKNG